MAQAVLFVCSSCDKSIEAWDEGEPYYLDENGNKIYAYHPSQERELCIGNDSPHLCLNCSEQFMVDSEAPVSSCPKCSSSDICDIYKLERKKCPFCKAGTFE